MMDIEKIREGMREIQAGMSKLSGGPLDYYLENLLLAYDLLMARFSPFKVGDRVSLTKAPEIGKDSGWRTCEHFLVVGAVATVRAADCVKGKLSFGLEFDHESWIDHHGKVQPVIQKHLFYFGEAYLTKTIS